jgi:hypothetical protein
MKRFFYVLIFVAGFMLLNNKVSAEYSKVNAVAETILESVNTNAVNAADAVSNAVSESLDSSQDDDDLWLICWEYYEIYGYEYFIIHDRECIYYGCCLEFICAYECLLILIL